MSDIIQDVSELMKIVGCDYEYYESQSESTDPYYEYTMYLVNNGVSVEGQGYTDMYYGARKCTDVLFVDEYPNANTYPSNKIYIQKVTQEVSGEDVVAYQMYFKCKRTDDESEDVIIPVATSAIASVNYDTQGTNPTVVITWNVEGEAQVTTRMLVVNSEGELPESVVNSVIESVVDYLDTNGYLVKWEPIS